MQGASDTNSWYDCYRGLRNKLNLEGTEISAAIWIPFYRYRADNSSNAESHGDSDFR